MTALHLRHPPGWRDSPEHPPPPVSEILTLKDSTDMLTVAY